MVCRIDGRNSILTGVFQQIGPVLLLSDDRLQGFSSLLVLLSVLKGGRGMQGMGAPGRNPATTENSKKRLSVIYIYIPHIPFLKKFFKIKKD